MTTQQDRTQIAVAQADRVAGAQIAALQELRDMILAGDADDSSQVQIAAAIRAPLLARIAKLERNVRGWVEWHRRCDADDDCTYLNDNAWCDAEALASTGMGLIARAALTKESTDGQ